MFVEIFSEFYYHMYGSGVNTLNIYLKQNNQLGAPVWTKVKEQGNRWIRGLLRIGKQANKYQIAFEGISGTSSFIIALDDIRLLDSCPKLTNRFCDFESDDLCGYSNETTKSNIFWTRGKKKGSTTGPAFDQ